MRVLYEANDGTIFDNLETCQAYDEKFSDPNHCKVCDGIGEVYVEDQHDCWGSVRLIYRLCYACNGTGKHDQELFALYNEYKRIGHLLGIKK